MSTLMIVMLFAVGIILMALEFFVIPGFGISGILGIAALITGIVYATHSVLEGVLITGGTLVAMALLVYLSFRSPETNLLWKKLALNAKQNNLDGYVAPKAENKQYLGQPGIALTPLRPAGTGEFCGRRLDVVTEGEFIGRGCNIEVMAVEGTRIVVREQRGVPVNC
jgi:membrane-bound ClpP family serine protease